MKIRMRSDLLLFERNQGFESSWVIKDPISFEHFLFSARELFLLRQLDGEKSESEIVNTWKDTFKSQSLTIEELRLFVRRLIRDRLVIVEQLGYGRAIGTQQGKNRARVRTGWLFNPLAIRFRGFNPAWVLRKLSWVGTILFHPVVVGLVMLISCLVFVHAFGHFEDVVAKLPAIEQLLSTRGLIGLVVTISIIKILHEMGHALACRRFGGECHEIGVILLALIPTLYCNVSDAWTFRSRWKRMMVSFAGMYVEICLATIAAVIWLWTPPSIVNAVCFNVMLLCSVNTLLVNGNPLLRYDGYYMLIDWWEKPDLSRRANEAVSKFWLSLFLVPDKTRQEPVLILAYGLLSSIYRWFVLAMILLGIIMVVGKAGSYPIGYAVATVLLITVLAATMKRNFQIMSGVQFQGWSLARVAGSAIAIFGLGWFVWFVPLASYVYCAASVEQSDPVRIYAASDGQLVGVVANYEEVFAGDEIVRIENTLLTRNRESKRRQIEQDVKRLLALNRRVNQEPNLVAKIGTLEKKISASKNEQALLDKTIRELVVVAPSAGMVLPAKANKSRFLDEMDVDSGNEHGHGKWEGHVNAVKNEGCFVSRGQHLLTIGDVENRVVALLVNESDMGFVEIGQEVQVRFETLPTALQTGRVAKIQRQEVRLDQEMIDLGIVTPDMMFVDDGGKSQLLQLPFRVEVEFDDLAARAFTGSSGKAKISVRHQTVAERVSRLISRSLATKR